MFLGVDGGGTKTAFCLIDSDGVVVGRYRGGSAYYFAVGVEGVEHVLREGIVAVCRSAGVEIAAIRQAFFGLPTYGESSNDIGMLDSLPAQILPRERYTCNNDMVCGWAGSLGAVDGINVIAGTGSMAYGEYRGKVARCGGWGELFGDEGSAYWIAIRGLSLFSRMSDGRAVPGPLADLVRDHLKLSSDLDLVDIVLNQWKGDRARIADLCKLVCKAAEAGDPDAFGILEGASDELVNLVEVTRHALGFDDELPVDVSYSGGVFESSVLLRDAFRRRIADRHAGYRLCQPKFSPDYGAAIYAARVNGTPIDPSKLAVAAQKSAVPATDGEG